MRNPLYCPADRPEKSPIAAEDHGRALKFIRPVARLTANRWLSIVNAFTGVSQFAPAGGI
jgi:hypothetical protein